MKGWRLYLIDWLYNLSWSLEPRCDYAPVRECALQTGPGLLLLGRVRLRGVHRFPPAVRPGPAGLPGGLRGHESPGGGGGAGTAAGGVVEEVQMFICGRLKQAVQFLEDQTFFPVVGVWNKDFFIFESKVNRVMLLGEKKNTKRSRRDSAITCGRQETSDFPVSKWKKIPELRKIDFF